MPTIEDLKRIELEEYKTGLRQEEEQETKYANPFADQAFNSCPVCEPFEMEDIPDRLGLPIDDVRIIIDQVDGMTFLKLEDTPAAYTGKSGQFPMVNDAEDALEFGEGAGGSLWKKRGKHIYNKNYRDGGVGMGTNDPHPDYKAHVEGDFMARSGTSGTDLNVDAVGRQ